MSVPIFSVAFGKGVAGQGWWARAGRVPRSSRRPNGRLRAYRGPRSGDGSRPLPTRLPPRRSGRAARRRDLCRPLEPERSRRRRPRGEHQEAGRYAGAGRPQGEDSPDGCSRRTIDAQGAARLGSCRDRREPFALSVACRCTQSLRIQRAARAARLLSELDSIGRGARRLVGPDPPVRCAASCPALAVASRVPLTAVFSSPGCSSRLPASWIRAAPLPPLSPLPPVRRPAHACCRIPCPSHTVLSPALRPLSSHPCICT